MFSLARTVLAATRSARCLSTTAIVRSSAPPPVRSTFSGMSNDGLTESQIDVREAIGKICEEFPDEYWAEKDQ